MQYLLQVTLYTAILYGVYLLALRNRVTHSISRAYLLLCATLPLIIPFVKVNISGHSALSDKIAQMQLPELSIYARATAHAASMNVWIMLYITVVVLLIVRLARQLLLFRQFVTSNIVQQKDGINLLLNTSAGPGSFMSYIFFPGSSVDPIIYDHEAAHIHLRHSADIIGIRILQAIIWPNVMLYLVMKELKAIHEFQADAVASADKKQYVTALLNDTFHTDRFALSHTFFFHPLKRRIIMLQKTPPGRSTLRATMLKTGLSATIVLTGIIYLQSCKQSDTPAKLAASGTKVVYDTLSAKGVTGHREVLSKAEKMPHAEYDIAKYLGDNVKYPENARKKGTQGRVVVKLVVNSDGTVSDTKVMNNADPELAAEALRVVSSMPPWTPAEDKGQKVAVTMYQPISFKL